MYSIRGKLILKETGAGIPNLVVVMYDLDPYLKVQELFEPAKIGNNRDLWTKIRGDRLGSVISDATGFFELVYKEDAYIQDDASLVSKRENRPDLYLLVTAPEEPNACSCPFILHTACGVRQNAGRLEHYLIQLPAALLKKSGMWLPKSLLPESDHPEEYLHRLRSTEEREEQIRQGKRELAKRKLKKVKEQQLKIQKVLSSPVKVFSVIPEEIRKKAHYIEPGEDIQAKTFQVIEETINTQINNHEKPTVRTVTLALSDEQKQKLSENGAYRDNIPAEEFHNLVFQRADHPGRTIDLIHLDPISRCKAQTGPHDPCTPLPAPAPVVENSDPAPPRVDEQEPSAFSAEQLSLQIKNLIDKQGAAHETTADHATKRANKEDIETYITQFQLRKGPADTPAFYEFHSLQIAFQQVWCEAFDDEHFRLLKETYQQIEDLGGEPENINTNSGGWTTALFQLGKKLLETQQQDPPVNVVRAFEIVADEWNVLSSELQRELGILADQYVENRNEAKKGLLGTGMATEPSNLTGMAALVGMGVAVGQQAAQILAQQNLEFLQLTMARAKHYNDLAKNIYQDAERIIQHARNILSTSPIDYAQLHQLLNALQERIKEDYAFTIYAADKSAHSVNFGILVTYQQRWEPLNYQPGKLVKTIPLAPKETCKYSKKVVLKKSRSEKEVQNNLRTSRDETASTHRAESEIIRKANTKSNFQLSTESDFDILIASGKVSTQFNKEDAQSSDEIKKAFHESVVKSAQEYKEDRTIEINTQDSRDTEVTESGEISNPNDELTVTYLFYELQRRYRVSEKIHRVRPVIFVAQEVPKPNDINEDWLVAHDWILRRVLLDDSFAPALHYLSTGLVGHEFALKELRKTMELQRSVVEKIKEDVTVFRNQAGQRYAALEKSVQRRADLVDQEENQGFLGGLFEGIFGGSGQSEEGARIREEAAKDAYERAAREEQEMRGRLEREVTALNAATETYTRALRDHLNRKVQIDRLRVHVKENILYYMQAIWNHEPPDQRYFRLHKVAVPSFTGQLVYRNVTPAPNNTNTYPLWGTEPVQVQAQCRLDLPLQSTTLSEVADLDNLLGYKGNYMIFPLKQANCLTQFMMTPYVDAALNLRDPDEFGNWTLEEFADYVCCLKTQMDDEAFARIRDSLRDHYSTLLSAPRRASEEIVVPTGSLFIESLPGTHPILEDFKLLHRATDVKKVQAEVCRAELENLRLAARLLNADYDDPDIDRQITVKGNPNIVLSSENGGS